MRQASAFPTRKVMAGGLAGALTIILVGILDRFQIEVTTAEAQSLTVVITALVSYFTPPSDTDVIVNPEPEEDAP